MNDEAIFIRVVQNSEIEEFEEPSLGLFPNPSDGRINIPVNLFEAGDLTFKIYDLAGKEVYNKTSHFDAGQHLVVIPSELNSGQYILSVDQNDIHFGERKKMLFERKWLRDRIRSVKRLASLEKCLWMMFRQLCVG